jgi:hypothetical protein
LKCSCTYLQAFQVKALRLQQLNAAHPSSFVANMLQNFQSNNITSFSRTYL